MKTETPAQHTPGPWHQHTDGSKIYASVRSAKGQIVADCGSRSDQIAQANARLIAAAPELLAALESVLGLIPDGDMDSHAIACPGKDDGCGICFARAALAKATGRA